VFASLNKLGDLLHIM